MTEESRGIAAKQSIPKHLRYTITDFNRDFPNDDVCLEFIKRMRVEEGVTPCEKCAKMGKFHRVSGRTAYACDSCGHHIYPLAGSIFEKTSTSLRLWFYAMYFMASTRCGISAKQIQRETGVTYKTAWRMFKQIRSLLSEEIQLEGPPVEMDETYFGGKRRQGKKEFGRVSKVGRPRGDDPQKTPIVGIVERKGRVIARATNSVGSETLLGMVREYVLPKSIIYTDEYNAYSGITKMGMGYQHRRIHHASKVYVVGDIHTNTIDGFWSLVKKGIGGVYHSVSKKYLQTYLDEYAYRYNRRDHGNLIFKAVLMEVGKKAEPMPLPRVREIETPSA